MSAAGAAPARPAPPPPGGEGRRLLEESQALADRALELALDRLARPVRLDRGPGEHVVPPRLMEVMRYAALSPGKRLRPALVFAGARAVGGQPEDVLSAAAAVEMIHAYSLVHDDLPAIDDDDLRRGRPTSHTVYGEALALLAGDALLTEAFALLSDARPLAKGRRPRAKDRVRAVQLLARAAGAGGMVGGQVDDVLLGDDGPVTRALLTSVHQRKTGRLIQAAAALGAALLGASEKRVRALARYGGALGLAFQLVDDLLDGDGLTRLAGEEETRRAAEEATGAALAALSGFGRRADPLRALAQASLERKT